MDCDTNSLMAPSFPGLNDDPIWVSEFDDKSAKEFVLQLQRQSAKDPTAPILIYIDSFGGSAHGLLTMISAMESVPNQLITVSLGKAMSAGAVLLACGDIRYASPHSSIMVHEMSTWIGGHIDDVNVEHENIIRLNEYIMQLLAKKCKIKSGLAGLKKKLKGVRDLYLTAEEAVTFGLVDRIGVPMLQQKHSTEWSLMLARGNGETKGKA